MSRTKGSKNKPKGPGPLTMSNSNAGNPNFNIANVEPTNVLSQEIAPGHILPEDMELERSLQAMVAEMPVIDDIDPTAGVEVKHVQVKHEMLAEIVDDYKPAASYVELQEQAALAKANGCDSIEATLEACRKVCRDPQLESVGYFTYHGINVYLVGAFEKAKLRDRLSIEQRTFGRSSEAERREALKVQIQALEKQLSEH